LDWIDDAIKSKLLFEEGYGLPFGMSDTRFAAVSGGILSRAKLFQECEVALLAKPVQEDFDDMKAGRIHWGCPHCIQQRRITQTAMDKKLTLIVWEAMHRWSVRGDWQMHIFQNSNEIAGYAGVHHAMNLLGIDGNYGPNRKAVTSERGSRYYGFYAKALFS
jgi:alanine dehydrogenase